MSTKIKKNSEGKKVYELAFLLKDPSSEKVVFDFLAQHKAVILNQSPVNSMKLAYPIKKHLSGFFGVINLEADPENVKALSSALNLSADVLRFLIIAVPNAKKSSEKERSEPRRMSKTETTSSSSGSSSVLSNKALEERLEEILK
ncbi:MAG: 30S ribosomal protein S6 [bacterium]|nr:30S ribosomal protein S6 [bacterium]